MPFRIGKKSYPNDVEGMLRHRKLAIKLHTFLQSEISSENSAFLMMMSAKKSLRYLYEDYISRDCKAPLNIPAKMTTACTNLADQDDCSPQFWRKPLLAIRQEIINLIAKDPFLRFLKSDVFREFCFKEAGDPRKAAKLLGLKDANTLGDVLMLYHRGFPDLAERKLTALIRKEKKKKDAAQMYLMLKTKGFVA